MNPFRTVLAVALAVAVAAPAHAQERFDVLIRGGRVIDGSGNPWFEADVGIRDGTIVAVGRLDGAAAARTIEAAGKVVAPGFIDLHSHADDGNRDPGEATIRTDSIHRKSAPNVVSQGVTTVVVNHDGRSPWPISEQRGLLERQGVGPNVMLMVGHGQLRYLAMGEEPEDYAREATPAEVARMRTLLRQALEEGAVGLSAGLEYTPGRYSATDEVAALAEELVPFDGVYVSHERSEGPDPMWYWPSQDAAGAPTLIDAVMETIEIGERSGARVVASHIKAKGAHYWGSSATVIQLVEAARARGVRVWADQYPYPTSGSDGSTVLLPSWAIRIPGEDRDDRTPPAEVLRRTLRDPAKVADLERDVAHEIRRRGGADRVVIFEYPDSALVGLSLAEVAARRGVDPIQAAIRLQLEGDPERPAGGRLRGFSMSEEDVERYAARPWVATASDGGIAVAADGSVHPRYYGTFPRKIAHYARDRGVLSVEDAVRSMTSLPALLTGVRDRGMLREGMRADVVVFDLEDLEDRATFFEPHQHAAGIEWVLVNGQAVVEEGRLTGALPGQVIPSRRAGRPVSP